MQPKYEVADILHALGNKVEHIGLNSWQLRTLSLIKRCRTSELGGHIDKCDDCGKLHLSYNSCRNRHCPKCQGKNREDWIRKRETELLPVPYFHVVFTLPDATNALAIYQPKLVYETLFEAAWETLKKFGSNQFLQMGMIAILHTWGQTLTLHPHLHCIVPGGGVNKSGQWQNIRADGKFLFHVKALSKVFRAKFCEKIKAKDALQYQKIRIALWGKEWVVFAKRPFGRFALHILPKRFVKIRHYGFLSSTWKRHKLKKLQQKMGVQMVEKQEKVIVLAKCPHCKTGNMHTSGRFRSTGVSWLGFQPPRNSSCSAGYF